MALRNTSDRYGSVAITLHWLVATLFLVSYVSVYYRHWFTERNTPENLLALDIHLAVGVTIGAFVLLRVLWRLTNPSPRLAPGPGWEHLAARLGHLLLYMAMIAMPVTGYLGTGRATDLVLFKVPAFKDTAWYEWLVFEVLGKDFDYTFKDFEAPLDFLHKDVGGALLVWILIVIHVAAAIYHHRVKRDNTLNRMLGRD